MLIDWIKVGDAWSGFFQIDPSKAEAYFESQRGARQNRSSELLIHAGYEFLMRFDFRNYNRGIFKAQGNDYFGTSRMEGQVNRNEIEFTKTYSEPTRDTNKKPIEFKFTGSAVIIGNSMIVGGTYESLGKYKKHRGIWQVDENPNGKLASPGWMDPKPWPLHPLRLTRD